MLVDNETNQLNPPSEGKPSTPERPSGSSLEEQLFMHVEPEQSHPPTEECLVLTQHKNENYSMSMDEDEVLICETQVAGQSIHATSAVTSVSYDEQPSTPERSSDPSLEERSAQHNTTLVITKTINIYEQPSTHEQSSDPSLEEQFQDSVSHGTLTLGVNNVMDDSEVENFLIPSMRSSPEKTSPYMK